MFQFLTSLESTIENRKKTLPEGSYTTTLFRGGADRILRKIGEEAGEVIIAGKNQNSDEIKNEMADLFFHLLIFLHHSGLQFKDVVEVLEKRQS